MTRNFLPCFHFSERLTRNVVILSREGKWLREGKSHLVIQWAKTQIHEGFPVLPTGLVTPGMAFYFSCVHLVPLLLLCRSASHFLIWSPTSVKQRAHSNRFLCWSPSLLSLYFHTCCLYFTGYSFLRQADLWCVMMLLGLNRKEVTGIMLFPTILTHLHSSLCFLSWAGRRQDYSMKTKMRQSMGPFAIIITHFNGDMEPQPGCIN